MSAALEVQQKLELIAGTGSLDQMITEARGHLAKINNERWRAPQARGRIKRFLYLEQRPEPEEVDDIRDAYDDFCDEQERLARHILSTVEIARGADPHRYQRHIERLVSVVDRLRRLASAG